MQASITHEFVRTLMPKDRPYEVRDVRLKGFLLRVQPSGSTTFYVEYGRGKRKRLGSGTALAPSQARERAKEVLAEVALGGDPMAAQREAKAHIFGSFLTEVYEPWARANIRTTKNTLGRLRANFPELQDKKLADINAWLVEKWRAARLKAGAKPTTVNRDLDDLRSALAKAVAWGLLEAHPLQGVKRSRADTSATVRFLNDEEEMRLRDALDAREERIRAERDRANAWRLERGYPTLPDLRRHALADHLKPLVLLSMNTGLRRGEAFNLEWADVNVARANLTIQGRGSKSGRTRHIPLNAEALEVLKDWRARCRQTDGLIFPSRNGERLDNVRKSWMSALKEAGISRFRWHDLRHHFASRLVMSGVDLNTVRELLGHASYAMTLRYAHLAPEHKAAAVARLVRGQ
jgi:integrase